MSVHERLCIERERLGVSQSRLGAIAGVGKTTVINWEKGASSPTAVQLSELAAAGLDVLYVITGTRVGGVVPPPTLTDDERELLRLFRAAPLAVKAAAIGALSAQGGESRHGSTTIGVMTNSAPGGIQVGTGKVTVKKGR